MHVDQETQTAAEPILHAHPSRNERESRCIAKEGIESAGAAARTSADARCSPDPHAGTDRYHLAAPFLFRL